MSLVFLLFIATSSAKKNDKSHRTAAAEWCINSAYDLIVLSLVDQLCINFKYLHWDFPLGPFQLHSDDH
ncbi:hypothetical protein T08_1467 [Trichinella sp. T8]|nr:hypothetical protein T08_1467 [Trichinella sp. T8]